MEQDDNARVKFYCRELLNGRPAISLPPDLVGKICSVLEAVKSNAIRDGNAQRVRQVQGILAEVRTVQEKNLKHKENKRSTGLPSIYLNDPNNANRTSNELNKTLERLVNGGSYERLDREIVPDLISFTRKKIDSLVKQKALMRAQKYENVLNKLLAMPITHYRMVVQQEKRQGLTEHLASAKRSLSEELHKMEAELEAHEQNAREARAKLYQECESALAEFDSTTSGDLPPSYRKSSQKLVTLREQESMLTKARRFEDAAMVKSEADDLEKSETLEQRRKFEADRQAKRMKLQEQQKHKIIFFEQNNARVRSKIESSYANNIKSIEQLIANLERKLRDTEIAARGTRSTGPSRPRSPRHNSSFMLSQGSSPRTGHPSQSALLSRAKYRMIPSKWRLTSNAGAANRY